MKLSGKYIGIVIAWRRSGYGWLGWGDQRVWLHIQDVRDQQGRYVPALQVGQSIEFDVIQAPKGPRAKNARIVEVDTLSSPEVPTNDHTV
jgi:cold shock CspA family protein